MKKIIIFFGYLCILTLISACENFDVSKLSDEDLKRISEKAVVCNPPYIRFAASCCLDQNENSICDADEGLIERDDPKSYNNGEDNKDNGKDKDDGEDENDSNKKYGERYCKKNELTIDLCEKQIDMEEKFHCYIQESTKRNDYCPCYALKGLTDSEGPNGKDLVDGCLNSLGSALRNIEMCKLSKKLDGDKNECIEDVAKITLNIELCNLIQDINEGPNQMSCNIAVALKANNPTLCPVKYIDSCYVAVGTSTKQYEFCLKANLKETDDWFNSKSSCIYDYAKSTSDVSKCELIEHQNWKQKCLNELGGI